MTPEIEKSILFLVCPQEDFVGRLEYGARRPNRLTSATRLPGACVGTRIAETNATPSSRPRCSSTTPPCQAATGAR